MLRSYGVATVKYLAGPLAQKFVLFSFDLSISKDEAKPTYLNNHFEVT